MFEAIAGNEHPDMLKAPTGSGKTESVLFPALTQDRLFLPLPTRSLLEDQKSGWEYLKQFSKLQPGREVSLCWYRVWDAPVGVPRRARD